jgi:uncharacterized membrane protein YkoI
LKTKHFSPKLLLDRGPALFLIRRNLVKLRLHSAALGASLAMATISPPSGHAADRELYDLRQSIQRGEIRPLSEVLSAIHHKLPGVVTKAEIERKHGSWLYELDVIDRNTGRELEVEVDARSAEIKRIKKE